MCWTMTTLWSLNGCDAANREPTLFDRANVSGTSLMDCKAASSFCVQTSDAVGIALQSSSMVLRTGADCHWGMNG